MDSNQLNEEQIKLLRDIAEFGLEWSVTHSSPSIFYKNNGLGSVNRADLAALVKAGCLSVLLTKQDQPDPTLIYQMTEEGIRQFVACFPGLKALADKLNVVG